ncbi:MAG: hypothetical protein ACYCRH_04135 [Acidiferrobacteraceae bacterium]
MPLNTLKYSSQWSKFGAKKWCQPGADTEAKLATHTLLDTAPLPAVRADARCGTINFVIVFTGNL